MDDNFNTIEQSNKKISTKKLYIFLALIFVTICFIFLAAPFGSKDTIIHISSGQSVNSVVTELKNKNIIKNDLALKVFIKFFKKGRGIITGDYLIKKNSPVFVVAWQIGRGNYNLKPTKVTIREGLTNEQIAPKVVVIQFQDESSADDGYPGNVHLLYETIGSGSALMFMDGKVIVGEWQKDSRTTRSKFLNESGDEIELNRGQIWIQIVPTGSKVTY